MILSALALSAALSMPNFALWIEVTNNKTQEVKKYHTELYFKPKPGETIFTIPLHGTKKKIPIRHSKIKNIEGFRVTWSWKLIILNNPIVATYGWCDYDPRRGHRPDAESEMIQYGTPTYGTHTIYVHCFEPKGIPPSLMSPDP
jgi:hypothetical protein